MLTIQDAPSTTLTTTTVDHAYDRRQHRGTTERIGPSCGPRHQGLPGLGAQGPETGGGHERPPRRDQARREVHQGMCRQRDGGSERVTQSPDRGPGPGAHRRREERGAGVADDRVRPEMAARSAQNRAPTDHRGHHRQQVVDDCRRLEDEEAQNAPQAHDRSSPAANARRSPQANLTSLV